MVTLDRNQIFYFASWSAIALFAILDLLTVIEFAERWWQLTDESGQGFAMFVLLVFSCFRLTFFTLGMFGVIKENIEIMKLIVLAMVILFLVALLRHKEAIDYWLLILQVTATSMTVYIAYLMNQERDGYLANI
ncbi:hypothetical protein HDE_04799 [Halotydeus destructor]|nr:hypothetical protein HDE_04799 [Halotydeus destructor]